MGWGCPLKRAPCNRGVLHHLGQVLQSSLQFSWCSFTQDGGFYVKLPSFVLNLMLLFSRERLCNLLVTMPQGSCRDTNICACCIRLTAVSRVNWSFYPVSLNSTGNVGPAPSCRRLYRMVVSTGIATCWTMGLHHFSFTFEYFWDPEHSRKVRRHVGCEGKSIIRKTLGLVGEQRWLKRLNHGFSDLIWDR